MSDRRLLLRDDRRQTGFPYVTIAFRAESTQTNCQSNAKPALLPWIVIGSQTSEQKEQLNRHHRMFSETQLKGSRVFASEELCCCCVQGTKKASGDANCRENVTGIAVGWNSSDKTRWHRTTLLTQSTRSNWKLAQETLQDVRLHDRLLYW